MDHSTADGFVSAMATKKAVLDDRSKDNFNVAETEGLQFSVAPDNAVIPHRQVHCSEKFSDDQCEF